MPIGSLAAGKHYNESLYAPKGYEIELEKYNWGAWSDTHKLKSTEGVLEVYNGVSTARKDKPAGMVTEAYLSLLKGQKTLNKERVKGVAKAGIQGYFVEFKTEPMSEGETGLEYVSDSFKNLKEHIKPRVDTFNLGVSEREQLESIIYVTMLERGFEFKALDDVVDVTHALLNDLKGNIFNLDFCIVGDGEKAVTDVEFMKDKELYLYNRADVDKGVFYKQEFLNGSLFDKVLELTSNQALEVYRPKTTIGLKGVLGVEHKESFLLEGIYNIVLSRKSVKNVLTNVGVTEDNIHKVNRREVANKAAELIKSKVGYPYSQARRSTLKAFDCSSLVWWVYHELGVYLSNDWSNTSAQLAFAEANKITVSRTSLQVGDLIYYDRDNEGYYKGVGHVGMYVGNGEMVDARGTEYGVVKRPVDHRRVLAYVRPLNLIK